MGSDPDTSVTDSSSRVWGFENLHLAGNGLFSERNACNPTLQTVSFALRAADHMFGRLDEAVAR
ncbi:MAG TPA: GMC oxidoreductase [Acidimicrobiia bacterium]|nr:GMC oxidoreductase [Acidimicrobiia bacterium]